MIGPGLLALAAGLMDDEALPLRAKPPKVRAPRSEREKAAEVKARAKADDKRARKAALRLARLRAEQAAR